MPTRSRWSTTPLAVSLLILVVAMGPFTLNASAAEWTETSDSDFLGGARERVDVTPGGDVQLSPPVGPWRKVAMVLDVGPPGSADSARAHIPSVLAESDGSYKMWYTGFDGGVNRIMFATSADGLAWTKRGIAIDLGIPPYYFSSVTSQAVLKIGPEYHMWFGGTYWGGGPEGVYTSLYYANSTDGMTWSIQGETLGLGPAGSWDDATVYYPSVYLDAEGSFWLFYSGWNGQVVRVGLARSTSAMAFTRWSGNPILDLGQAGSWDDSWVFEPSLASANPWQLYYAGWSGTTVSIGTAISDDGYNWTKNPANPSLVSDPAPAWDSVWVAAPSFVFAPAGPRLYFEGADGSYRRIGLAVERLDETRNGSYFSRAFDSGGSGTTWQSVAWNATTPALTSLGIEVRAGDTSIPDVSWTQWQSAESNPASLGLPRTRYIQYRATLNSMSDGATPTLHDVTVRYARNEAPVAIPAAPALDAWTNSTSMLLRWDALDAEADPQASFEVELSQDSTFATGIISSGVTLGGTNSWQSPSLSDGLWSWRVRIADGFGAWSGWSSNRFGVDTSPPTLRVEEPVTGSLLGSSRVRTSWVGSDSGSGIDHFELRLDDGQAAVVDRTISAYEFSSVPDGAHSISIKAVDGAGNAVTGTTSFRVDANVFSLTGPYGPWPLGTVAGVAIVAIGAVAFLSYRRKKRIS